MRMKKSTMLLLLLLLASAAGLPDTGQPGVKYFLWLGRAKEMLQEMQLKRRQNIPLY